MKRNVSLLLVFIMIFSILPVAAFAEGADTLIEKLEVQTEPAPQSIEVLVKCGSTQLAPADFNVYEGDNLFDRELTGDEKATITVKLSDDAKRIYKPNECSVEADGIIAEEGTCANGEYNATIYLNDYTKGGTVTFNLTEKGTIGIRVCMGQKPFDKMQNYLTYTKTYDGKLFKIGLLNMSTGWSDTFFEQSGIVFTIRNNTYDVDPSDITYYWVDAQGNRPAIDNMTNAGIYKMFVKYDGNDNYKPIAATELVTLNITKAERTDVPQMPTLVSKTANSLTVENRDENGNLETGVEWMLYGSDNGTIKEPITDWVQGENGQVTFDGLTDGTRYFIDARYAESDNQSASDPCAVPLQADTVYVPKKIKVFGYVTDLTELIPNLFEVYLADAEGKPTDEKVTTITAGESNAKRVVISLTESARERYYLDNSTSSGAPVGYQTGMIRKDSSPIDAYSFLTTISSDRDKLGNYLEETDINPCLRIKVVEKYAVSFTNFEDVTVTYGESYDMETAQPNVATDVAAYSGELEYYYTDKDGVSSTQAPVMAGTYTVTVKIPAGNPEYEGQATATLTIEPKEVELIGLAVKEKIYDGECAAELDETEASLVGVLPGDEALVNCNVISATFNSANVDEANAVTIVAQLEGTLKNNYKLKAHAPIDASIRPKDIFITFEGTMEHVYDGQPKQVTAKLEGILENDAASVTVVYGTDTTSPILAGDYLLTAKNLSNSNYKPADDPYTQEAASRTLKIALGEYTPGNSSAEKSIGYLDTEEKSYDLSELFGIDIPGTFEVLLLEENEILAKNALVSGNATVQLREGRIVGEAATITYAFTPAAANTYKPFTVTLHVKVAEEIVDRMEVLDSPETGDAANPAFWLGLAVLSLAGIAVTGIARRKLERKN